MTTVPTIGFNVESVTYKNLNFNVWVWHRLMFYEIRMLIFLSLGFRYFRILTLLTYSTADLELAKGVKQAYGPIGDVTTPTLLPLEYLSLSHRLFMATDEWIQVVFVVDATDKDRITTASEELSAMLNEEELKDAALLVFANKQDQPGVLTAADISDALKLARLKDRSWSIYSCSAVTGDGMGPSRQIEKFIQVNNKQQESPKAWTG